MKYEKYLVKKDKQDLLLSLKTLDKNYLLKNRPVREAFSFFSVREAFSFFSVREAFSFFSSHLKVYMT